MNSTRCEYCKEDCYHQDETCRSCGAPLFSQVLLYPGNYFCKEDNTIWQVHEPMKVYDLEHFVKLSDDYEEAQMQVVGDLPPVPSYVNQGWTGTATWVETWESPLSDEEIQQMSYSYEEALHYWHEKHSTLNRLKGDGNMKWFVLALIIGYLCRVVAGLLLL